MVDGIIQVTDINYDDIMDTTYEIVLMFCAGVLLNNLFNNQYVGLCKDHRQPYVRAAAVLAKLDKPIYIGEVDGNDNKYLMDKFNITDYPTFLSVYSFGRDPETIKVMNTDTYVMNI